MLNSSKKYNKNISFISIAIILTGIAVLFFSCSNNKIEEIKELSTSNRQDGMTANNFELLYSDSGTVIFKLITPRLIRYEETKEPFTEFPDGVIIEKYDKNMEITSKISSDYAQYFDRKKQWIAKNNVVVINQNNDSLKTEELIWEEKSKKIHSDKFVTIIRAEQIINGIGFESDQSLADWQIKEVTGDIYLNVKQ
ncbi:MAG: LPS export ABC transporter periplasmic protein LptC [Prolixibacteraceae bacterium]|nr:LPS export ABC transporter periplasmic protein LptC [Prolixibacteraceae bacterium]